MVLQDRERKIDGGEGGELKGKIALACPVIAVLHVRDDI